MKRSIAAVLMVIVVAVAVRVALPFLVIHYINGQLATLEHYQGHIEDVDLLLIAGRYHIHGMHLMRTGGDPELPLFAADTTSLLLSWRALLDGRAEGSIRVDNGQLNIIDGATPEDRQTGREEQWNELVDSLFPFVINRIEVNNGSFHFRNLQSDPPVDVALGSIHLAVTNLRNRAVEEGQRLAHFQGESTVEEHARLRIHGDYEWLESEPDFNLHLQLQELPISVLNDLLRAYLNIDAQGRLTVTAEIAARNGELSGYVQPLVDELNILEWKKDIEQDEDSLPVVAWQGLLDFFTELFENQPASQFGSRIPITGQLEQVEMASFAAILSTLYNAFIQALDPDYEPPAANPGAAADANPDATAESSGETETP